MSTATFYNSPKLVIYQVSKQPRVQAPVFLPLDRGGHGAACKGQSQDLLQACPPQGLCFISCHIIEE